MRDQVLIFYSYPTYYQMGYMFYTATAFNQDLCHFGDYFSQITDTTDMFVGSGCLDKTSPTGPAGPWCEVTNCPQSR